MFEAVPWMKLVYTGMIVALGVILVRELWTIWLDDRIYIGKFDIITTAGTSDADSNLFPKQIVASQKILASQIDEYQTRRTADQAADVTYVLPGMVPLNIPAAALPGMEITYQGVNFTNILGTIRKSFLQRNEVSGLVTSRGGSVQAAIDWDGAPTIAGAPVLRRFLTSPQPALQDVAEQIACTMSYATAAARDCKVAAWPRAQFCEWASALGDYYALATEASTGDGLGVPEVAQVRRRVARLRSHYGDSAVFAEIYRLRADLLDMLPEAGRTQAELVEAQEDRIRYSMLSPALAELAPEDKRFAALALARPAIPLSRGWSQHIPENWAALLAPRADAINAAAASTALLLDDNGIPGGTGFVVAPGVLMTVNFVLQKNRPGATACFGHHKDACDVTGAIGETLYDGGADNSYISLVRISGEAASLLPPLPVAETLAKPNELTGRYTMIIGFQFPDQRIPRGFLNRILDVANGDKAGGDRRLMPGRILAFGARSGGNQTGQPSNEFTTDLSSASGSGGSPLIDVMTGKVIGVHYAGIWQGERGKFSYAQAVPAAALAIIAHENGMSAAAVPMVAGPPPQSSGRAP